MTDRRRGLVGTLLVITGIAILGSCVTPEAPPPPEPDFTESSFRARGLELLEEPSFDGFLHHITEFGSEFSQAREALLDALAQREEDVVSNLLDEDQPFEALRRLGTLYAVPGAESAAAALRLRVARALRTQGSDAAAETIDPSGVPIAPQPPIPEADAITDYRSLLGQVHVRTHYENPDGIKRFTPDTFSGSGFLLDERHLLTAYHVVEELHWEDVTRSQIMVYLQDDWYEAELLAWDSILDVAVLELDETVEVPVSGIERLSRRMELEFGEPVLTLGHHSGLTETLTRGVVSAPGRRAPELGNWIQIDASVTGGASGGLLIGQDGYIEGLLIAGLIGEDLNFAVPATSIRTVIDRLLRGESVRRPWMGLALNPETVTDERTPGVEVRDVFPSSPVARYDVRAGDEIVQINHQEFHTVQEAQALLAQASPGNAVHLLVKTAAGDRELWIQALSRPDYALYNGHERYDRIKTLYPFFGFAIDYDNPDVEARIGPTQSDRVLFYPVVAVEEYSFLDSRGVKPGDRLGILLDEFVGMTRVIQVVHLPEYMPLGGWHNIEDYIFTMERGRYDANIL